MLGHGEKLSRKKEQAISCLLQYPTVERAAQAAGVSSITLFRWMKQEDFKTAYEEARRELLTRTIGRIQSAAGEALEVLRGIMNDSTAPISCRVSAARTVLETCFRAAEQYDTREWLQELENKIGG